MRASTLVGLALALLLGAVAVVGVRYSGLLESTPPVSEKQEPVMVLAAAKNLFKGTTILSIDVKLRPATDSELRFLRDNPDKAMPANIEAAHQREAEEHVAAETMLLQRHFKPQKFPESTTERLDPGMRSVNVVLPKEQAAGGVLRINEHVDVYLTSTICNDAKCNNPRTATALLAPHLKVIVKRDTLWPVLASDPEGRPVSFVLQANPYRAALIELAKTKGTISLIPTSNNVKNPAILAAMDDSVRVSTFLNGESSVTDQDLERIFNLAPIQSPEPPLAIEHFRGVDYVGTTVLDKSYGRAQTASGSGGYGFFIPAGKAGSTDNCPNCVRK